MKNKNKFKLITIITAGSLLFLLVAILLINNLDGQQIKEEYESLNGKISPENKEYIKVNINKNNIMKYTTEKEIINIINNKDDAVIYLGYPSCAYCRTTLQVLHDTAKDTELDVIYYLDTEKNKVNKGLINILGEEFNDNNKLYSPAVIFIKDGKIASYHKGTVYSQTDPYKKLDKDQIKGLSEIYRYGINDVIGIK